MEGSNLGKQQPRVEIARSKMDCDADYDARGSEAWSTIRPERKEGESSNAESSRPPIISPLDRQWSSNSTSYGSVVPGFGTNSDEQHGALCGDRVQSIPSFNESWNASCSSFAGEDMPAFLGQPQSMKSPPSRRNTPTGAGAGIPGNFHSPSLPRSKANFLVGNETDVSSMIHDAARIMNWRTVLASCKEVPQCAGYAGPDGWTALHHACSRRCPDADVVEALIRAYPAALIEIGDKGMTPLHYACRFKAPKEVVRLLLHLYPTRGRAAVSLRDRKGRTPLFYAVQYAAPDGVIEMLLEIYPGAVLDEDRSGESPLALIWDNWTEKSEGKRTLHPFLYPEGSSLKGDSDIDLSSVLQQKLKNNTKLSIRWKMANLFLRAVFGFNHDHEHTDGTQGADKRRKWRVLHAAAAIKCHSTLFMISSALHPEQASETDNNDLRTTCSDFIESTHQTALHVAASAPANGEGGGAIVRALLDLYPNAAQVPDGIDGSLPLHRIVENERKIHWISDGIRDVYNTYPLAVQTVDKLGRLPLHRAAVLSRHIASPNTTPMEGGSIVCNLLEAYPDAASKADISGRLALHLVAEHGEVWDDEAEAILNAHPAAARARAGSELYNRLPIHMAAASPDARRSLIERLVELHPRGVAQSDRVGKLPLHLACESGKAWDKGVCAIYEAYPAAICKAEGNHRRWMALHMAAACPNSSADFIEKLTELHPAAARECDNRGRLPLHLSCSSGKSWDGGLRQIFEANPAAITSEDSSGMLPFHIAAFCYCSSSAGGETNEEARKSEEERARFVRSSNIRRRTSSPQEKVDHDAPKLEILFQLLKMAPDILRYC